MMMNSPLTTQMLINITDYNPLLPRSKASKERHRIYNRAYKKRNRERTNELKRQSHLRHRDSNLAKCKEYHIKNRERDLISKRKYNAAISAAWGSIGLQHKWNDDIVARSEEFVASQVLPKLGFVDILLARPLVKRFPFDILAKDSEGKECGFDVKLGIHHCIPKNKMILIRHLGLRHFIVHVNRNLDFYLVKEMFGKRSSSAVKEFMEREKIKCQAL